MTAAIKGEQSTWVREEGVTTYTRQNTKLSMALLDRVNPATALPEILAVATRFDCFLEMIDEGLSAEELWIHFFEDALPHGDIEARARVRAALQLCEETAAFDEAERREREEEAPIEYKSMDAPAHLGRAASQAVSMGRVSAYRLCERAGAESFAAAWDKAINAGREMQYCIAMDRAMNGVTTVRVHRGGLVSLEHGPEMRLINAALRDPPAPPSRTAPPTPHA